MKYFDRQKNRLVASQAMSWPMDDDRRFSRSRSSWLHWYCCLIDPIGSSTRLTHPYWSGWLILLISKWWSILNSNRLLTRPSHNYGLWEDHRRCKRESQSKTTREHQKRASPDVIGNSNLGPRIWQEKDEIDSSQFNLMVTNYRNYWQSIAQSLQSSALHTNFIIAAFGGRFDEI